MIIGIDFGTCYSSAAIMNGLIPVTNFVKDSTGMGIPSLFMYSEAEGKELYGEQCLTGAALRNPADIVRNMKRIVREDPANLGRTVASGGREYTVSQVIEKFLAYLIGEIRMAAVKSGEYRSSEIEAITITAPVGIASGQMMASEYNRLLHDTVCAITGLPEDRVRILQEPVAAAISYLYSEDIRTHYDNTQRILVFDLGGGTLDVSIVEHDPATQEYRILAKEGDLELGGNDWDAALAAAVLGKIGITWDGTDEERVRFDMAVTKLKALLSQEEEQMIVFTMGGKDYYTRFTRAEFEDCTRGLLDRAMDVVRKALDFSPDVRPDMAVLVGGSSNMPQIANGLADDGLFEPDAIKVYEPSKAIAKGAAVYAKLNFSTDGPAEGPKVLDMATLTYGFESRYGGERDCIYNMIYKGTQFEDGRIVRRSETSFVPLRDNQTCVTFDVFESECAQDGGFDGNWFEFGNGEVYNGLRVTVQVPPEYLGKARGFRMWATLSLDENGILEITVTDRTGNKLGFASTAKGDGQ